MESLPQIPPELEGQDYYFMGDFIQIQGQARLPEKTMEYVQQDSEDVKETIYFTFQERRDICRRLALFNSHTKWLSLTFQDRQNQDEWSLRLQLGARGKWSHCLDNAVIRRLHFDDSESCRAQVLYPCLPQDY